LIVYLDASALVKRYVAETGSADVATLVDSAQLAATAVISRAEVAAALAKAARMGLAERELLAASLADVEKDWNDCMRLEVNEHTVARAAALAWAQQLRGYDAVHLACAQVWQEALGEAVTLATYDRELWRAAGATGVQPWPGVMP
jgi:predicted nucleic acid-binding protein